MGGSNVNTPVEIAIRIGVVGILAPFAFASAVV
jgi:hypothetical protein